jgi:hypothetical protein
VILVVNGLNFESCAFIVRSGIVICSQHKLTLDSTQRGGKASSSVLGNDQRPQSRRRTHVAAYLALVAVD